MTTYLRVTSAIATLLILTACAAPTANVKPTAGASGAVAQTPACLSETGSRIAGNNGNCSAGRSYSSDDISRTGSTTTGEALRLLDPSITVHH